MSQSPFIPFYTSDFLGGTGGMTAATKGVYITLLCLMYESEGPLPQKWDMLSRRCGATLPAFKNAVQDLIDDGKIVVLDDGLWSEKCEKHLSQRRDRSSSASAAAKKRWQKTEQKQGQADANASVSQCKPEPYPDIKKREAKASPKNGVRLSPDWFLPASWGKWAIDEGASQELIRSEADKFKDYWIGVAGAKARKADWEATWRNWIRKAINDSKPKFTAITGGQHVKPANKSQQRMDAFLRGAQITS